MKDTRVRMTIKYEVQNREVLEVTLIQFPKNGYSMAIEDFAKMCRYFAIQMIYHPDTAAKFFRDEKTAEEFWDNDEVHKELMSEIERLKANQRECGGNCHCNH